MTAFDLPIGYANAGWLCCPHCDNYYLHKEEYRLTFSGDDYAPCDAPTFAVDANTLHPTSTKGNNLSTRYGPGIEIKFRCENCCEQSFLHIAQHKGMTNVYWYN